MSRWSPWYLLGGLALGVAAVVLIGLREWLQAAWDCLLDWGPGQYWPAVAAVLAPSIAVVRSYEDNSLPKDQAFTVALMLLAITATQFYGQARAERYRKLADAEARAISAASRQQLGFLAEQGAQLRCIADAIGSIADEITEIKDNISDIREDLEGRGSRG